MKTIKMMSLLLFIAGVANAETFNNMFTSGNPWHPMATFYGYQSSTVGPGDDAFEKCLALARKDHRPLLLVYGRDNCATCSSYCSAMNSKIRDRGPTFAIGDSVNGYFRGNKYGPKACNDALEFFKDHLGATGDCHLLAYYGVFEDGTEYKVCTTLMTSYESFTSWVLNQARTYKKLYEKHRYVPPKASAVFGCAHMEVADSAPASCCGLEIANGVETLYVPISRTNNTAMVETNGLKVVSGDGAITNRVFVWQKNQVNLEVPVSFAGDTNTAWKLILVNTNGQEVATNTVMRRSGAVENGFYFPRYIGEEDSYDFGEWTLDLAAATNAVAEKAAMPVAAVKSYTLAVSGSSTTDAKLEAFAQQVFASTNFTNWATNNNVALVLLDRPMSGNTILNHTHDNDDACYISLKGLRAYTNTVAAAGDTVALSAEAMMNQLEAWDKVYRKDSGSEEAEYILIRSDGTVAGRLTAQMTQDTKTKAWTCNIDENMARLNELLKEVDDKTEAVNGSEKTPLTFEWQKTVKTAQVVGQTLAVSDTEDWYRLTGDGWVGKKVVFKLNASNADPTADPRIEVLVKGQVVNPELSLIWHGDQSEISPIYISEPTPTLIFETNYVFRADDILSSNVFVRVIAWDGASATTSKFNGMTRFNYSIVASEAQNGPGIVSFVTPNYSVLSQDSEGNDTNCVVELVRVAGSYNDIDGYVSVDVDATSAIGWYEFDPTNVHWSAGETGIKAITVKLKGKDSCECRGMSNIVLSVAFRGTAEMKDALQAKTIYTITYGLNPTNEGAIAIKQATPAVSLDGRVYVRRNSEQLSLIIERSGGKGPAAGYLSFVSGGKSLEKRTLEWSDYDTSLRQEKWIGEELPTPSARTGYADAIVKLTASNGFDVVKDKDTVNVRVLAKDAPAFANGSVTWGDAVQYVAFSNAVAVTYGGQGSAALPTGWTVWGAARIAGALPTGLKATVNKATGALMITGTPTAATEEPATSIWWIKFKDAQGNVVMSSPVTVTITVKALAKTEDNPGGLVPGFDTARSWSGLPLVDAQTKRLAGLLDMTVLTKGRTTAKWRKAGGKVVSFNAASLTGCVQEGAKTNVYVEATKKQSGVMNEFYVRFLADGAIAGTVSSDGVYAAFEVPAAKVWSKTHTAEDWAGNYTLAFLHDEAFEFNTNTYCTGATSLRVKFDTAAQWKTGRATFAGMLPNGVSVSGTAFFVPAATNAVSAQLPIFYSTAADTFGAAVDVVESAEDANAIEPNDGITNFWQHVESGIPEASYDNDYTVIGTRYEADDWEERWLNDYNTNELCFVVSVTNNSVVVFANTGARVAAKGAALRVADKGELKSLSFSLNNTLGIATGSFRDSDGTFAEGKTATWRGVALPGCTPFTAGAYWYTTKVLDNKGRSRSVKAGGEVMLEPIE